MKTYWWIVLLTVASPLFAADKPAPKLEGQWKVTWGADRGRAVFDLFDTHWTISADDKVIVTYGTDPKVNIVDNFTTILDPKNRTLDRKRGDEMTLGLFEMDDEDHLTVCFNYSSKARPTTIDSNPTYGYTVYRLERVKAKKPE